MEDAALRDDSTLRYAIEPLNPGAHLFRVRCTVPDPDPTGQVFSFAAWIPGSYMIRDFAKNVVSFAATADGRTVAVEKLDKQTWRCPPCEAPLTVTCEVYAWDLSVRGAHLDTTHAYFNGPAVFPRVHGWEERPCLLEIQPPVGVEYKAWQVATSLVRHGASPHGFGMYRAEDYSDLLDHPVEMGEFALARFEACGVPHEVAVTGRHRADLERLAGDLRRVCEQHIALFGQPPPMDRYLFLVTAIGEGYGGLEHRRSTSLLCSRDDLPRAGEREIREAYRSLLGLASHEYFHLWNVKRITPAAFVPYDLGREVHTRLLWAFEGITSYYDDLALVRSGLITPQSYLELLGQTVTRVLRGRGRFRQSVAESSFDAWTKFYRQDENAPNAIVSYYAKGALVALALDLIVRRDTQDHRSLDDIMRALWERHGTTGEGVPEDGIERLAQEVSGLDLRDFFRLAVHGTEDLPLNELLESVGIELELRPAESDTDKGGKPAAKDSAVLAARPVLGLRLARGELRVAQVFDGGAAQQAGIAAGDEIIALDGLRATRDRLDRMLEGYVPGDTVRVDLFRRDELMSFAVHLQPAPVDTCVMRLREDVEEAVRLRRTRWLAQ
jgi:predicted metalloprotease with PDZ domain